MRIKLHLAVVCLYLFANLSLFSQTQFIGPNGGDWSNPAHWNNGLPASGNNALIGGGSDVSINNPLTVDFSITNYGSISVNINLTNLGVIDNSGSLSINGNSGFFNSSVFNNYGTTIFGGNATFTNEASGSFTNTGGFVVQTLLVNKGSVTNNGAINAANGTLQTEGTFVNNQGLTTESLTVAGGSSFTNNFGSDLIITGASANLVVDGSFNNLGSLIAEGSFTINGTLSNSSSVSIVGTLTVNASAQFNNAGGVVDNHGAILNHGTFVNGFQLNNIGSFENFGQLNNNNLISVQNGGTFQNKTGGAISMGYGSKILNNGYVINAGGINSYGTLENNNLFDNYGTITSFSGSKIINHGVFTNYGSINSNDQVSNFFNFVNNGSISVNAGSQWFNNANLTNGIAGTITCVQDFNNLGNFVNNGQYRNLVRTKNSGTLTNNALLYNSGDITNETGGIIINNELVLQEAGNILNIGQLNNANRLISDECSTISNDGTIANTGDLEVHAVIFQRGSLTGDPVNCQGCYVHTSPDSDAPSVCGNFSFGADITGDVKVYATALIAFENFDSCTNIIYLANGEPRPVFNCSDIGTTISINVVMKTRLNDSLTCTSIITPEDILEPQFAGCPNDIVVYTPAASEVVDWDEPVFTDNCTPVSVVSSHTPGDSFPIGITGVSYTGSDAYGNSNSCQFRVDMRQSPPGGNCNGDTNAPMFLNCPADIVVTTTGFNAIAAWVAPIAEDDCYPVFVNASHVPGYSFQLGTTTVTYTAVDGNNNEGTCSFDITVNSENQCLTDVTAPSFSNCPVNISLPANPVTNSAVAIWAAPNVYDLCSVASINSSHNSGSVFPAGTTQVSYTATDSNGNSSTCNFVVTVGADPCPDVTSPPVFAGCPVDQAITTTSGFEAANWTAPSATSACGAVTINSNFQPGDMFPLGTTKVTYVASDLKGNSSACSFNISIQNECTIDNNPPVIANCPQSMAVANNGGSAQAFWTAPTATDDCGLIIFSSSFLPGAAFPVGITTVVYTALDLSGNIASCEFNVSVVDVADCTSNASPINLSTNIDPTSITLTWNSVANATGYDVKLGTTNPPTQTVISNTSGTSATVSNLAGNTTYYWYVVPKNVAGSPSGCSATATQFTTSAASAGNCGRVTDGLIAMYDFKNGGGDVVKDVSGIGQPMNLFINNPNAVTWKDGCGLSVDGATTIQSNGPASKLTEAVQQTNEITIEAWVCPANTTQNGPSRIATISQDPYNRNVTLGQDNGQYVARLRTTSGGNSNGMPTVYTPNYVTTTLQHVVYTRNAAGQESIYVDGVERYSGTRAGELSNWDAGYHFALANELTNDRPWLGEFYFVAVYNNHFTASEVTKNYEAGACCTDSPSGCSLNALFVVGSTNLNSSDAAAKQRLENLGFNVNVIDDNYTATSDANGMDLILISSTTLSTNVNSKFRNVPVAVINYEGWLHDDFRMTGYSTNYDYGSSGGEYYINITNPSHPIAAGLSGNVVVYNYTNTLTWGSPQPSAIVATLPGNYSRATIFAYDTGDQMVGQAAPARRVGFFLHNDNADILTSEGAALFDAAARWAAGLNTPGSACDDGNPQTINDVYSADGCTCAGIPCTGEVLEFTFYDIDNGVNYPLVDGGTYYLGELPANFNIEAMVAGDVESVSFEIGGDAAATHTENLFPYRFIGDNNPLNLAPGEYKLAAAVFSEDYAGGYSCDQRSISFTLLEGTPVPPAYKLLQTGEITFEQDNGNAWYFVSFEYPFDEIPVVVVGPPSANSTEQVIPRIRNINQNGFEFQMDEWNYLNGYHPVETMFYMAMPPGNHEIDGVTIEAGTVQSNSSWSSYYFNQSFGNAPVLLHTVSSYNDANAVAPRARNVSGNGFQMKLQEEDNSYHANETLNYIAVSEGSFGHNGQKFIAGITPNSVRHYWYQVDFGAFLLNPGFLANFHTYDGGDVCALRYQNLTGSTVEIRVEEEQYFDYETNHTTEQVGWLVFGTNSTLTLAGNQQARFQFEALKGEEHTELFWVHNDGEAVVEYLLERSSDGTDFEVIATSDSKGGNSNEMYQGYDLEPLTGDNFYRVKMVKTDGTADYSDELLVHFTDLVNFTLFPNPANDFVKINLEEVVGAENVSIQIFNSLGIQMETYEIDKVWSKYYQLDLRKLHEGHYIVWLNVPNRRPLAKQLIVGKVR